MLRTIITVSLLFVLAIPLFAAAPELVPNTDALYQIWDGQTKQVNALWGENPKSMQFGDGRTKVVIADLKGPGIITMIHFALPAAMKLNRDTVLRIYWDGEKSPSVQAPLVDFFCDPNGALERVDSALVNKKRGWNCYFPMPFAKSARVEVAQDSYRYPGGSWSANPCYSYVIYRTVKKLPADSGYFHAEWRQKSLLMGKDEYKVFEADGKGQFIGWNMSVRGVGSPTAGYPVDENENFYVDGEKEPSISWQGLEDSFGFSWGFPEQANSFPYTGYQPYYNGGAAYRFTLNDRISFKKTMRMTVGFGKTEKFFQELFSKPENPLEFSSVAYWYQVEPHKAFASMPPSRERRPSMLTAAYKPQGPGEALVLNCGTSREDVYLADGWDYAFKQGYGFQGPQWPTEINYCWADNKSLDFDLICPKGASGMLRMFILDGDNFQGGRKQSIKVAGRMIGEYESFQTGKWIEVPISATDTASGRIPVVMKNLNPSANAVVSQIRFLTK
jgi:hypothetical protein